MGYSHYWKLNRQVSDAEFELFLDDVERIDPSLVISQDGERMVWKEVWETFVFRRTDTRFRFCKTGQNGGDEYVTAVLAVAKHHFGDDLQVSSDGNWSDWAKGLLIAKQACGIEHLSNFCVDEILTDDDLVSMAAEYGVLKDVRP